MYFQACHLCFHTVGYDANGKLLGIELDYYQDCGCYANDGFDIIANALHACDNAYYCANWEVSLCYHDFDCYFAIALS